GARHACRRLKQFVVPRRKRLLIVEDNATERMAIAELLGHTDIDTLTAGTGAEALDIMRRGPTDCVVLDLRLPDMVGQQFLTQIREDPSLADVPVVVFTGRALSSEEDAALHSLARSVIVKGVDSPERLLDETALYLHRAISELPPEKQRMLERLHKSDEDLVGKTAVLV